MTSAEATLARVNIGLCFPLLLLMNFSLFQYLLTTYWKRRHERRVQLLLFVAAVSFGSLIPYGLSEHELNANLNNVSEVCSVLSFLLQITILTRDVGKRIKIRSLRVLLWIGELLVVLSLFTLFSNAADISSTAIDFSDVARIDDVLEIVSLLFIVCFRFYFLSIAKGFRKVWETQKAEIVYYLLLLTHSVPFTLLDHFTGLSWEYVQGVWMRTTIILCLWRTVKARLASQSSKQGNTTGRMSGPRHSAFDYEAVVHKAVTHNAAVRRPRETSSSKVTAPSFRSFAAVAPTPGPHF